MDTEEQFKEHTKIKLNVYKRYLEAYLSIMMLTYFKKIIVVDAFAGKGGGINIDGSAEIAKSVIENTDKQDNKEVILELNDIDLAYYNELVKRMGDCPFARIHNEDANKTILDLIRNNAADAHMLFFIDPWGYTQIKGDVYEKLFTHDHADILIFIPTYQIYRFLRKEDSDCQLKPIAKFLSDIGIAETDATSSQDAEEFNCKIKQALKSKANTKYVYLKELKNTSCNNKYALFFITKHILGAEKFLEAIDRVKEHDLFENTISDEDSKFISCLEAKHILSNKEIYELGILNERLPKKINAILKVLENANHLKIEALMGKRKKGIFYIGYTYYKEVKPRISVEFI